MQVRAARKTGDGALVDLLMRDGLWCALTDQGMGELSEQANTDLGIDRAAQDEFAARSQRRAQQATEAGRLTAEIVPVAKVDLDHDEGIRG